MEYESQRFYFFSTFFLFCTYLFSWRHALFLFLFFFYILVQNLTNLESYSAGLNLFCSLTECCICIFTFEINHAESSNEKKKVFFLFLMRKKNLHNLYHFYINFHGGFQFIFLWKSESVHTHLFILRKIRRGFFLLYFCRKWCTQINCIYHSKSLSVNILKNRTKLEQLKNKNLSSSTETKFSKCFSFN